MDTSENQKVDWNKYLDNKTAITAVAMIGAFVLAYMGKFDQNISIFLAAAVGSFNWFGK